MLKMLNDIHINIPELPSKIITFYGVEESQGHLEVTENYKPAMPVILSKNSKLPSGFIPRVFDL